MNPGEFIKTGLKEVLERIPSRNGPPALGVDEGLNDKKYVWPLVKSLQSNRIVDHGVALWHKQQQLKKGKIYKPADSFRPPWAIPELWEDVRGASCHDENIVSSLVYYFTAHDRLCLLTTNTKNDKGGLRWILEREVQPAIAVTFPDRIGLLVLFQKPGSTLEQYCTAVESYLTQKGVGPGYNSQIIG